MLKTTISKKTKSREKQVKAFEERDLLALS